MPLYIHELHDDVSCEQDGDLAVWECYSAGKIFLLLIL